MQNGFVVEPRFSFKLLDLEAIKPIADKTLGSSDLLHYFPNKTQPFPNNAFLYDLTSFPEKATSYVHELSYIKFLMVKEVIQEKATPFALNKLSMLIAVLRKSNIAALQTLHWLQMPRFFSWPKILKLGFCKFLLKQKDFTEEPIEDDDFTFRLYSTLLELPRPCHRDPAVFYATPGQWLRSSSSKDRGTWTNTILGHFPIAIFGDLGFFLVILRMVTALYPL
jgi:hypothetical protein